MIKSDDHEDKNFKNYNEIVEDLRRLAPELSDDDESEEEEIEKIEEKPEDELEIHEKELADK